MKLSENRESINPSLRVLLSAGPWLTSGCQCPGQVGAKQQSSGSFLSDQEKPMPIRAELPAFPGRGNEGWGAGDNHIRL